MVARRGAKASGKSTCLETGTSGHARDWISAVVVLDYPVLAIADQRVVVLLALRHRGEWQLPIGMRG